MRRTRHESGVTIVEASFALPILFMFVMGMVDLGMWTLNSNQATNAARDGARAGVLLYQFADVDGHPHNTAVVAAVRDHLPDGTVDGSDVVVRCEDDGTAVACEHARVDDDQIRVEVRWDWNLLTPAAAILGIDSGAARGSATMAIVGAPVAGAGESGPEPEPDPDDGEEDGETTEPAACTATSLTTNPSSVGSKGNQLEEDLWVHFTTNGSPACADLRIELVGTKNNPTTLQYRCGCGDGPTDFAWAYRGSNNIWQAGIGTVRLLNGNELLRTTTFFVT